MTHNADKDAAALALQVEYLTQCISQLRNAVYSLLPHDRLWEFTEGVRRLDEEMAGFARDLEVRFPTEETTVTPPAERNDS